MDNNNNNTNMNINHINDKDIENTEWDCMR